MVVLKTLGTVLKPRAWMTVPRISHELEEDMMSKFCFDWQWPGIVPGPGLASRNYMNLFHILIWCPAYHCTVLYCSVLYCTVLQVEAWRRNLRSNSDRLVSHFDIHRTLAHFVTRDSGVTRGSHNTSHVARAPVSLLDTVVSPNRTCQQVGR